MIGPQGRGPGETRAIGEMALRGFRHARDLSSPHANSQILWIVSSPIESIQFTPDLGTPESINNNFCLFNRQGLL
jgi:hypothetical protein